MIERQIHRGAGQHERKVLTFAGKFQKGWKLMVSQTVLDKDQSSKCSERYGRETLDKLLKVKPSTTEIRNRDMM